MRTKLVIQYPSLSDHAERLFKQSFALSFSVHIYLKNIAWAIGMGLFAKSKYLDSSHMKFVINSSYFITSNKYDLCIYNSVKHLHCFINWILYLEIKEYLRLQSLKTILIMFYGYVENTWIKTICKENWHSFYC